MEENTGKNIENYEPKSENKINKKKITLVGLGLLLILLVFVLISSLVSSKLKEISTPKTEQNQETTAPTNTRKKITENKGYEGEKSQFLVQNKEKVTNVTDTSRNVKEIRPQIQIEEKIDESLKAYYEQLLQEELAARKSVIQFDDVEKTGTNTSFIPGTNTNANMPNFGNVLPQEADQNKIKEKKEFLKGTNEDKVTIYNPYEVVSPLSEYQVNAGSIIPGIFITGVKSTLPGRMIGQVRENVYDSTTGNHLLIPKGARLLGMYDSNVTFGQDRIMIIWERIIFPNGKSIQLDRFAGTDLSGYAGATGKVNNHYGKLLTSVVLSSIIGAGTAIVENDNDDDWKVAAGEGAGEQIINIGTKFAEKVMNISPEITIATGQKFNIIVNSDTVLEPIK